ncbi:hypothetical protein TREMEDRAFT_74472 [Tremella mesenterica DSM 1558]|uniref:uncharacterized protein n=1 Tax=Tremella mesenterica (strain ATCC 24925 / CBS 8224 / DSM 1558 / NBRC 9311 / NRRL Y-6157 / RJB 2259-6 / UBC 559-6) TaxID=578456 RepID=UPI0003F4A1EE|nr:uncharacterized protein TREMEDRAFT_74472 [Tremella mesenterica DSM 1558]EIW67656.1 hypothetical protein TREMEDRAFT_74472 [Tremella mesenterica DSM 1558]
MAERFGKCDNFDLLDTSSGVAFNTLLTSRIDDPILQVTVHSPVQNSILSSAQQSIIPPSPNNRLLSIQMPNIGSSIPAPNPRSQIFASHTSLQDLTREGLPKVRDKPTSPPKAEEVAFRQTQPRDRRRNIPRPLALQSNTAPSAPSSLRNCFFASDTLSTPGTPGTPMGEMFKGERGLLGPSNPWKGKRSEGRVWGMLPFQVIHRIFDFALEQNVNSTLSYTCRSKEIDYHPFWHRYTRLMNPTRHYAHVSPFLRARSTMNTCLACRILYPTSTPSTTSPKSSFYHPFFKDISLCGKHQQSICMHCFLPSHSDNRDMFLRPHHRDMSATDSICSLPEGLICWRCRFTSVGLHIHQELSTIARTGPLRGTTIDYYQHPAATVYIQYAMGTAKAVAKRVVLDRWLMDQTRWTELEGTVRLLQQHEVYLWRRYQANKQRETKEEVKKRQDLLAELWGIETNAQDDQREREMVYRVFEYSSGIGQTPPMVKSEFLSVPSFSRKYSNLLCEASLSDFINDRFNFGFWLSPTAEITELLRPSNDATCLQSIVEGVQHPLGEGGDTTVELAYAQRAGLFSLVPGNKSTIATDPFLPPASLVNALEKRWETKLRETLRRPLLRSLQLDGRVRDTCLAKEALDRLSETEAWVSYRDTNFSVPTSSKFLQLDTPPEPSILSDLSQYTDIHTPGIENVEPQSHEHVSDQQTPGKIDNNMSSRSLIETPQRSNIISKAENQSEKSQRNRTLSPLDTGTKDWLPTPPGSTSPPYTSRFIDQLVFPRDPRVECVEKRDNEERPLTPISPEMEMSRKRKLSEDPELEHPNKKVFLENQTEPLSTAGSQDPPITSHDQSMVCASVDAMEEGKDSSQVNYSKFDQDSSGSTKDETPSTFIPIANSAVQNMTNQDITMNDNTMGQTQNTDSVISLLDYSDLWEDEEDNGDDIGIVPHVPHPSAELDLRTAQILADLMEEVRKDIPPPKSDCECGMCERVYQRVLSDWWQRR